MPKDQAHTADDIARLIGKTINARKSKTRYQPHIQMTMLVLAARKLPYKAFDKLMARTMRQTIQN